MKSFAIFAIIFMAATVNAGAFEDALGDFKVLLYSIAAGVAAVLIAIQGIRMKLANSPEDRKEAKKSMMLVLLGLALIVVAAAVVEMVYRVPEAL